MIIEISIAVIAFAFAALVIYLIAMTKVIRGLLGQVHQMLMQVRMQMVDLSGETKKLIEETNQMAADLKDKMEALNPIFRALENVGDVLEHKSAAFKQDSFAARPSLKTEVHSSLKSAARKEDVLETSTVDNVLELVDISIRLWQKLKKRR